MKTDKYKKLKEWISVLVPLGFGIYSFYVGYMKGSIFHYSIFGYYLILSFLRALLIFRKKESTVLLFFTSIMTIITNIVLIGPIILMALQRKESHYGEIMAISIAAYTTYKITSVIIRIRKSRAEQTSTMRLLLSLGLNDALLSIMNLQYTLIHTFDDGSKKTTTLSYVTNFILLSLMIVTSILALVTIIKNEKRKKKCKINA